MGLLPEKVVMVTGGARGQGRAHAIMSAREGADIIVLDILDQIDSVDYLMATEQDLFETVQAVEALDRRVLAQKADVRSQEQLDAVVAKALAEFGKIDVLIVNHGIWSRAPFWEMTEAMWSDMINVNLSGVWRSAKAVAPHMIERRAGSIVITASLNGVVPSAAWAHYTSAKHGAIGLMKNIARELAPFGVRCNAILPGGIRTPMVDNQSTWNMVAGHEDGTREEYLAAGYHSTALRGVGAIEPEEIAHAAAFLNSDLASKITGVSIPVDAGQLLLSPFNHNPFKP